jgi:DNA polymerase-3 subunit delta'
LDDLAMALQKERKLDEAQAGLIAHIAGGRPGYALRLIDDPGLLEDRQQAMQDCLNLLGLSRLERMLFVESLTKGRARTEAKGDLRGELTAWLSFWRDVLLVGLESDTPLTNLDYSSDVSRVVARTDPQTAARLVAALEHAFVRLNNANLQVMLDNLLLAWPRLA